MGVWNSLKNLVTRGSGQHVDDGVLDWPATGGGSGGSAWGATSQEFLAKYGQSSCLQTPARRTASDLALLKWYLYRRLPGRAGPSGPPKERIFEHDFLSLWQRPNPILVNYQFIFLTQIYLDIGRGECPWVLERKPGALKPDAIWPIPRHWVTHRPTPERPFWMLRLNGQMIPEPFPAGEVVWLHDPDPLEPYHKGLGIAPSLDDELAQDEWMNKFNNQFFRQGGHPGQVFGLEGVEHEAAKKIQANYEKKHAGIWNAFKVAFLGVPRGGKISVHSLGASHKDMDFVNGKNQKRDAALQAFNMQRFEVGINEDVNRASAQASADGKARNVTLPRATYLEQAVNAYLMPLFGDPSLIVEIENPVKETKEFELAKASEGLSRGAITIDEWRLSNGWDPLPDGEGNQRLTPLNVGSEPVGSPSRALAMLREIDPDAADLLERTIR